MQLSRNTSTGNIKLLLLKVVLILAVFIIAVIMLGKIDFPSPNKEIIKTIPNEKLKIVK